MTIHHEHVPIALRSDRNGSAGATRPATASRPRSPSTRTRAAAPSPTTRTTWSDYETALAAVEKYELDGVGYVFSDDDPFIGIDIDDCRDPETGVIAPWAQEIIDSVPTYWEVSPSGTGVKGWVEATR